MTADTNIPNIIIGQDYDSRYKDADIHYEALGNLADFFGRTMKMHRHDRYYQVHYVKTGTAYICLGEHQYQLEAPLFFITPPVIPHAFVTDEESDGHVLTIRQQFIWSLLDELPELKSQLKTMSICVSIKDLPKVLQQEAQHLTYLLEQLREETHTTNNGFLVAQQSLVRLIFISLLRLAGNIEIPNYEPVDHKAFYIFRQFNELVEFSYKDHFSLKYYAQQLIITEAKLNDACRQIANISPKQIIIDRLMQEAKYLLLFSSNSVRDIGYQLGFDDPAYFTRFFTRESKMTPKMYRQTIADKPYISYFVR